MSNEKSQPAEVCPKQRIEVLEAEVRGLTSDYKKLEKLHDDAVSTLDMYRHAWSRELGPRKGKSHEIDELTCGTQALHKRVALRDTRGADIEAACGQLRLRRGEAELSLG